MLGLVDLLCLLGAAGKFGGGFPGPDQRSRWTKGRAIRKRKLALAWSLGNVRDLCPYRGGCRW